MTIHINAKKGEIAPTILLPGDPLRAKFLADNFLSDVRQFNEVRGMLGYTGNYKGKSISVMGTGMGIPSISIYAHELVTEYKVKHLIRIGTAGSLSDKTKIGSLIAAISASTDSNIPKQTFPTASFSPSPSYRLIKAAENSAKREGIILSVGPVLSSDQFYMDKSDWWHCWRDHGILAVEMEAAGLYLVANRLGAEALAVVTVTDELYSGNKMDSTQRQTAVTQMMSVALGMTLDLE